MKKNKKRILAAVMTVLMALTLIPTWLLGGVFATTAKAENQGSFDSTGFDVVKLGTQTDSTSVTAEYKDDKVILNTADKGKMANTGQSGFVSYCKKVDVDKAATIRGSFKVTKLKKSDNQSSFGLIAFDTKGNGDATTDYVNQIDIAAATKCEAVGLKNANIPMARTYLYNTDSTGKTSAEDSKCDVTRALNVDADNFSKTNYNITYNFELEKNVNGITVTWYDDSWNTVLGTYTMYNPSKLLTQDDTGVYIGFYASRIGTVEVTNLSYEEHTFTEEEKQAINKVKWVDYDEVSFKTFNGTTTSDSDYRYRYYGNIAGTITVKDDKGNTYINDKSIAMNDTIEFNLSDYGKELEEGTTTFTTEIKPYVNSVNSATLKKEYSDRLLLEDYSTRVITDTVERKTIANGNSVVYVSPSGNAGNAGTQEAPLDLQTALSYANPGMTIKMMDGTYISSAPYTIPYSVSGTTDKHITLEPVNAGKVTIEGTKLNGGDSALFVQGDYWDIKNIEVTKAGQYTDPNKGLLVKAVKGIHVSGSYNTIERCDIHHNGTTGLQISYSGGEPKVWWPSYNTILNCDSYFNVDAKQNDADGFAAKLSVGEGNVFDGCASYNNADDGYDLYAKATAKYGPIGAVTIKNCVAYNNGILEDGTYSKASGNGFKLGGEGLTGKHKLIDSVSWNNGGSGIMSNNGPDCQVYNCIAVDNGVFSRNGGNADRNNYQLSPKNGAKYNGTTGYVLKNSISFYTDKIKETGTMACDKFVLLGQEESVIYNKSNYLCNDISTKISANSSNTQVAADWFETVDYTNVSPVRKEDGSLDMKGLFVLTEKAKAIMAEQNKTEDNNKPGNGGDVNKETYDMGDATVITKEMLEEIKGKDIEVTFDMGDYSWTINGKDIPDVELEDIDLKVTKDTNNISGDIVKTLSGENDVMQINISHNGEFKLTAKLNLNVGTKHSGEYANLFWYKEDGTFEYIDSSLIDADGNISLTFTHASDYVLVFGAEMNQTNAESANKLVKEKAGTEETSSEPASGTGDSSNMAAPIAMMIACIMVMGTVVFFEKKKTVK